MTWAYIQLASAVTLHWLLLSVRTKPHISKMVTLQEKEKTYFNLNASQWNQTCFQVILGRVFWSVNQEIYTPCKAQQIGRAHV